MDDFFGVVGKCFLIGFIVSLCTFGGLKIYDGSFVYLLKQHCKNCDVLS